MTPRKCHFLDYCCIVLCPRSGEPYTDPWVVPCVVSLGKHKNIFAFFIIARQWRHNGRDGVSNHQHSDCILNPSCRPRSKKTSKLRVTGLCVGNSPVTGEFSAQMASNAGNVSIGWRHHVIPRIISSHDQLLSGAYYYSVILNKEFDIMHPKHMGYVWTRLLFVIFSIYI